MKFFTSAFATALAAASLARAEDLCGDFDNTSEGGYIVNNNVWGAQGQNAQCLTVDQLSGSGASWHAKFSFSGDQSVKSYPYSGRLIDSPKFVKDIQSMKTSFSWGLDNPSVAGNIAYDLFTAAQSDHETSSGDYELMIWLAAPGDAAPIGTNTGTVNVGGSNWELWDGTNTESNNMHVYSFKSTSDMNSFNGDVKDFFNYVAQNKGFPAESQYLITFQAGIEARNGAGTFQVNGFTADVA